MVEWVNEAGSMKPSRPTSLTSGLHGRLRFALTMPKKEVERLSSGDDGVLVSIDNCDRVEALSALPRRSPGVLP
jgi:hypothetical protein